MIECGRKWVQKPVEAMGKGDSALKKEQSSSCYSRDMGSVVRGSTWAMRPPADVTRFGREARGARRAICVETKEARVGEKRKAEERGSGDVDTALVVCECGSRKSVVQPQVSLCISEPQ